MTQNNQNLMDFKFILDEILRFIKLTETDAKALAKSNDFFFTLSHPSGVGSLIIGRAAKQKFSDIADRILKSDPNLRERVEKDLVLETLEYIFCEEILKRGKEITSSLADKMASRAAQHVSKNKLQTLIHYFPCMAPADKKTDNFSIGVVNFLRTEKFLEKKALLLAAHTESAEKEYLNAAEKRGKEIDAAERQSIRAAAEGFSRDLAEYFSQYPWIASIEIKDFEKIRSKQAASICVKTALNILRLFLPPNYAEHISFTGARKGEVKEASLYEEDAEVEITCYRNWLYHSEDDWIKKTFHGQQGEWIALAGQLIQCLRLGTPVPLLYQRYMNGLWWYGEAMSADVPHIKIISLSNALEAVLSTSEGSGETIKQVATRADLLLRIVYPDIDWDKKVRNLYDIRSSLVHGRIPAFDREVPQYIDIGTKIARNVLIQTLSWTHYLSHQGECRDKLDEIHKYFETELQKFSDGTLPGFKEIE